MDSMQRKAVMEDASEYCRQVVADNLEESATAKRSPEQPTHSSRTGEALRRVETPGRPATGKDKPKKRKPANKTHSSTTDPDARMARKPGKPTNMYYHGQISVDAQHGVITAAMADYADKDDHKSLPGLMDAGPAQGAGGTGHRHPDEPQWHEENPCAWPR